MKNDDASKNQIPPRKVKCPQCGRLAVYSEENPFRPFCSDRCRLIDLGQWADESYRIPDQESGRSPTPGDDEELS